MRLLGGSKAQANECLALLEHAKILVRIRGKNSNRAHRSARFLFPGLISDRRPRVGAIIKQWDVQTIHIRRYVLRWLPYFFFPDILAQHMLHTAHHS